MPALGAGAASLAGLLALAACGPAAAPGNGTALPGPAPATNPNIGEVPDMNATESAGPSLPLRPSPPTQAAPDGSTTGGPRDAFIVCPGNPRCPPAGGTRPKREPD